MSTNEMIRVLLVEDQPEVIRMVADVLAQADRGGFFVESVSRVVDAVGRIAAGGIDLALLDLSLPDSQGLATFHQVFHAAPEVPIVVLTGLDDENTGLLALREGPRITSSRTRSVPGLSCARSDLASSANAGRRRAPGWPRLLSRPATPSSA